MNAERKKDGQAMQTFVAAELKKLENEMMRRNTGTKWDGERAVSIVTEKVDQVFAWCKKL